MANYRYDPDDIDDNSRHYAERQVLAASEHVLELVRQLPTATTAAATATATSTGGGGPRRPRDHTTVTNPTVTT